MCVVLRPRSLLFSPLSDTAEVIVAGASERSADMFAAWISRTIVRLYLRIVVVQKRVGDYR